MYSEEKMNKSNYQLYDDSYDEENNSGNSKWPIVIKILIIIACIILLFWLISLLKKDDVEKPVAYDPVIHNENITITRLAAERYFFKNNNLPEGNSTKTVTLKTLVNQKLGKNLVDSNSKICDVNNTTVSLKKETNYVMRINLSCSTNEKEEVFHYDGNTHVCLDCEGETYMDKKEEPQENVNEDDDNIFDYSCQEWTDWSNDRVVDSRLLERTRVLVRGIKKGKQEEKITYGDWSDWTTSSIASSDTLEVETKTESGSGWSSEKTTTEAITNSSRVKIISEQKEEDRTEKYCSSGTLQGNKCHQVRHGNLNYISYNSANIKNRTCSGVKTEKNSNGRYELIYQNCTYTILSEPLTRTIPGKTTYTYKT